MDKSVLQTTAIIATVIMAAWHIGGEVKEIGGEVKVNSAAITGLRDDMRDLRIEVKSEISELRSLLIMHIAGHSHAEKDNTVAKVGDSKAEAQ